MFLPIDLLKFYELVLSAWSYYPTVKKDINNPVIRVIINGIFTPIADGVMIFDWYAFKGEYDHLPESSKDL